jgi:hypothetical protein
MEIYFKTKENWLNILKLLDKHLWQKKNI